MAANLSSQTRADGTDIATRIGAGRGPTLLFLPGYASDMDGSKACALWAWAQAEGRAVALFDYGGCGQSGGRFEDQSFDDWLGDALRVIDALSGPVVVVGSSMGGWIALCCALHRPSRVVGLVGIAAAPDFTEWGLSASVRAQLGRSGRSETPSPYGGPPMVMTTAFVQSARRNLLLHGPIDLPIPIRLIQGQKDPEVPWHIAQSLAERIAHDDVALTLIKGGDHRLSTPGDIAILIGTVDALLSGR